MTLWVTEVRPSPFPWVGGGETHAGSLAPSEERLEFVWQAWQSSPGVQAMAWPLYLLPCLA